MSLREPRRTRVSLAKAPRKLGSKGLDRDSVLATAIRVADEVGINDLSLKRLAEEAGVAPPSIYTHYASLAEIKRELTLRAYHTLTQRATAEALGKAGADAVIAVSHAYLSFARMSPGLHSAMAVHIDETDQEFLDAAHAWVDLLYRVLSLYQLGPDEKIHVTRALRSLLYGFASMEQQGSFSLVHVDRDESFGQMIEGFVTGLQRYARQPD
jgi:AcrR family transcriptional regulator